MSNTKAVRITADVPFHWIDDLSTQDAKFIAQLLLSPATGIQYGYVQLQSVRNEHGGLTAMYKLTISGTEAFTVSTLVAILRRAGKVLEAAYTDLDDGCRQHVLVAREARSI